MFEWIYFNTNYSIKKSNSSFPKKVYGFFSCLSNNKRKSCGGKHVHITNFLCLFLYKEIFAPYLFHPRRSPSLWLSSCWVGEFKTGRIHMSQNIIFFYTTLFWRFQECAEAFASVEGRSNIYIYPIYLFISYLYIHIKIWYTSLSSHIFNSLLIEIQRPVQQCKWPKVILR